MDRILNIYRHFRLQPRLDPGTSLMTGVVTGCSVIIVVLLVIIAWLSFFEGMPGTPNISYTLGNYQEIYFDQFTYKVLLNTVEFSIISLVIAFLFGLPAAWLVERTDFRGKTFLFTIMSIGLLIPGFAVAMGWLFLLHPRIGILNQWLMNIFSLNQAPLSITTILGMGFVQGLNLAPLAFIMTAAVLRAMDPALEEAAQTSGANKTQTIFSVTIPLIRPGILAAAIYILTIGFAAFDVPAIIGWSNRIFTFSTYIYLQVSPQEDLPQYGAAAALSIFMIILAVLLSWWYRTVHARVHEYVVVTGKSYRPKLANLGAGIIPAWCFVGTYILLSKIIPIALLLWTSGLRFFEFPSFDALTRLTFVHYNSLPWDLVIRGAKNTGLLMVLTPIITILLSLAFSWVVLRSKVPGRFVFDFFAFLPHAIPNIIFGVGALLLALFVLQAIVPIYGTVWLLLLVFVIVRLSYGTRVVNSSLIQVHHELEEAAYVCGSGTLGVLWRILVPILKPPILYCCLWIALLTYRELTLAVILSTPNNITLPVVIWSLWNGGGLGPASALTIVMLGLLVPIVAVYWAVARRTGIIAQGN